MAIIQQMYIKSARFYTGRIKKTRLAPCFLSPPTCSLSQITKLEVEF